MYMNNNDTERFAINASNNNREFLLGGTASKGERIQSKEQKEEEEEDKEQVPLAHGTKECFYYTNRNIFELKKLSLQLLKSV
jgi:hypothetical protein